MELRARVARPCTQDWAAMSGDERVRACAACNQNVYDLSALSADEARALIAAREGKLCVRFWQRADGTVMTRDCPEGIAAARLRAAGLAAAGLVVAAAAAGSFALARGRLLPTHRPLGEGWLYPAPQKIMGYYQAPL